MSFSCLNCGTSKIRKENIKASTSTSSENEEEEPETSMKVEEIINYSGFKSEFHTVKTEDNYILGLHRILNKSTMEEQDERPNVFPVLLQHGVLADSSCWICVGAENSLPFVLAKAGFDVWLSSSRGTAYSREHVHLDADKNNEFWEFTWQDMSEKDLPAFVNYVLEETKKQKLHYIGHSQGCLIAFAALSESVTLNSKFASFQALAPVFRLKYLLGPLKNAAKIAASIAPSSSKFGTELLGSSWLTKKIARKIQKSQKSRAGNNKTRTLLANGIGLHLGHYFQDRLGVFFAHVPGGTSYHNALHYAQIVKCGKTRKYKHEKNKINMEKYGKKTPPSYDISKITAPVYLYYGNIDQFTHEKDIAYLLRNLKSVKHNQLYTNWDHMDFLLGADAPKILYTPIIEKLLSINEINKMM